MTHWPMLRSQCGAPDVHWASLVQPVRQTYWTGSQTGDAAGQSELPRHATHTPEATRHRGCRPEQSASVEHSTHCCVALSQIFASAGQSLAVEQPTHSPPGSQMPAARGQSWLRVHAAWHAWSPGQHDGVVPPPQSASLRHGTHAPERQYRRLARHCGSAVQATHPRVASHWRFGGQAFVPLAPHAALPPPGPPLSPPEPPPPHATTRPTPASNDAAVTFANVLIAGPFTCALRVRLVCQGRSAGQEGDVRSPKPGGTRTIVPAAGSPPP